MSSNETPQLPSKIIYLAQHPLFRGLIEPHMPAGWVPHSAEANAEVHRLLVRYEFKEFLGLDKIAEEFEFKKGAVLAYQGEYADQFFILRTGRVEAQEETKSHIFVRRVIHLPNAFFDDVTLFEPQVYPHYLKARTDGRVIIILRDKLIDLIKQNNALIRVMFPILSPEAQQLVRKSRLQEYLNPEWNWRVRLGGLFGRRRGMTPAEGQSSASFDRELARLHAKFQLQPEETIKFQTRRSPWLLIPHLFFPVLLLIALPALAYYVAGGWGMQALGWWGVVMWVAAVLPPLAYLIFNYIDWANDYFLITDRQIIHYEYDLRRFNSHLEKLPVERVQSVEVEVPNIFARLFQVGKARITTAAQAQVIIFDYIPTPEKVQLTLNQLRERTQSLSKARLSRDMRKVVETHFGIPAAYTKASSPPLKPKTPFQKTWEPVRDFLNSYSHRSEKNGVVTYHKHRITLVVALFAPTAIALLILVSWYFLHYFAGISFSNTLGRVILSLLVLLDLGYFIWQVEDWHNDTYQLTDKYVIDIDRAPFGLYESRKQAELSKVENVRTEKLGIIASLFNYGKIYVETAGTGSSIVFEQVYDPQAIQRDLFKRRDKLKEELQKQEQAERRKEYAAVMDSYNKAFTQHRIPTYQPLLEEGEGE